MKGQCKMGMKTMAVLFASALLLGQGNKMFAQTTRASAAPAGPGTVNYVEGQATVNGQILSQSAVGSLTVPSGGVVDTQTGYVEVLLTPGAFLRIGHNSEVRLIDAGLVNTRVQVIRGSAELEADQIVNGSKLSVDLNGVNSQIDKKGLYSFDAAQRTVRVLDGKLTVFEAGNHVDLTKGHQVLLANGEPLQKSNFDEKGAKQDQLYVWSRIRSQNLAQASYAAASNAEAYSMANSGWFWNPYMGYYGFWPASAYLYSPFGWGFYSPTYFGYYAGYWGRGYRAYPAYRPGLYGGAFRSGGFAGAAHGSGGFHGGGHR